MWALTQSRGDGNRLLVTPERVLSEYNEDLIFFSFGIPVCLNITNNWLIFENRYRYEISDQRLSYICESLKTENVRF